MAEPARKPAAPVMDAARTIGEISPEAVSTLEMMRDLLAAAGPITGNQALQLLRKAFPDRPLAERAAAVGRMSLDRG